MRLSRLHSDAARHGVAAAVLIVACIAAVLIAGALGVSIGDGSRSAALVAAFCAFGLYGPVFLLLTHVAFRGVTGSALRTRLRRSRKRGVLVHLLLVGGPKTWAAGIAIMGLATVGVLLLDEDVRGMPLLVAGCIVAIIGTWVLLVAVYAVEYARIWSMGKALEFPGDDDDRSLTDFLYLAVQVSTTFSTSDVQVKTTKARGLVIAHSVVAFAYSTVIIAVFVSLLMSIAG